MERASFQGIDAVNNSEGGMENVRQPGASSLNSPSDSLQLKPKNSLALVSDSETTAEALHRLVEILG